MEPVKALTIHAPMVALRECNDRSFSFSPLNNRLPIVRNAINAMQRSNRKKYANVTCMIDRHESARHEINILALCG
jgi:hypothetical protein